jgi:putative sterol carrier protein
MTDATAEFFEQLDKRGHEPLLHSVTGTLRFDLMHGGQIEQWLVTIDNGQVRVSRENAEADCVVRTDRALFDGLASGTANTMAALVRGSLAIEGSPELLVQFQRLFPGPPDQRQRQPVGAGRSPS